MLFLSFDLELKLEAAGNGESGGADVGGQLLTADSFIGWQNENTNLKMPVFRLWPWPNRTQVLSLLKCPNFTGNHQLIAGNHRISPLDT